MKARIWVCMILVMASLLPVSAQQSPATAGNAVVPPLVNFSGTLTDVIGKPLTGVVGVTFLLYKDEDGGAPLWIETQNVEPDKKGHYTVMLGSTTSSGLPNDIFVAGEARWLGVQVQGQSEQPRVLLLSVPYALKAGDAETLGGKPLSAFQLVAPESSTETVQNVVPAAEQTNEIVCASGTACKAAFVPLFSSNGGSAKVSDSIMTQTGTTVSVGGEVVGQTGFFRSGNSGTIFQATQTSNGAGVALAGVAEGTSGIGVKGSGVTGVSGFGLSNGTGVAGQGGTGIFGFSSPTSGFARATVGVLNTTASGSAAVFGIAQNASGQTFGVQGYNFSDTDFASGVSGVADGDQNKTFGVTGVSLSPNGTGLWGLGQGQSVTGGGVGCCVVGIWGDTSSSAAGAAGLVGTADDARAIYLQNNSPSGVPTAFMFQGAAGKLALVAGGAGGSCTVDTNGSLVCNGSKSAAVPVDNGTRQVALYAVESPQNWFEDFGSGKLANGAATITLDPVFAQTVNTTDYHVFLTPRGDCAGLYVAHTTAIGFEVRELRSGQSNVAFDYRIVALRSGYEKVRLEDKTEVMVKLTENTLAPSATSGPRWTPPARPKRMLTPALPSNRAVMTPAKLAAAGNTK